MVGTAIPGNTHNMGKRMCTNKKCIYKNEVMSWPFEMQKRTGGAGFLPSAVQYHLVTGKPNFFGNGCPKQWLPQDLGKRIALHSFGSTLHINNLKKKHIEPFDAHARKKKTSGFSILVDFRFYDQTSLPKKKHRVLWPSKVPAKAWDPSVEIVFGSVNIGRRFGNNNSTVDGRNPKQPPGMYKSRRKWWDIYCTTLTGFQPSTVLTLVECVFLRF